MKLKFKKTVPSGKTVYHAGQVYEVKDRHAAEVYVAHGYADAAPGETATRETLDHSHPAGRAEAPSAKPQPQAPITKG